MNNSEYSPLIQIRNFTNIQRIHNKQGFTINKELTMEEFVGTLLASKGNVASEAIEVYLKGKI